jgi:two-component system, cell cycle sensor histidine kinase and response regulator CckA
MNESLPESEQFLKMLVDFMPGMVGYWTKDLRSIFVSGEYLNWYGKSNEEMEGIPIQTLLGDELFSQHEPYIRAALAGESQAFDCRCAFKITQSCALNFTQALWSPLGAATVDSLS